MKRLYPVVSAGLWCVGALLALAALAPRVSAQAVVINEFLAQNASSYTNALGESGDWIELYNGETTPVNLGGWSLTDNPGNLRQWVFPAVVIPAHGYLVVWASGSAQSQIGGELHANFRLSGSGEYLGLVRPDGVTIASEYAPEFPVQSQNVSYGWRPVVSNVVLVAENAVYRYLIPSDGGLGTNWVNLAGVDDGVWTAAAGPLGYSVDPAHYDGVIETPVPAGTRGVYLRYRFEISEPGRWDSLVLRAAFDDGFVAYLNGVKVLTMQAPLDPQWDSQALGERPPEDVLSWEDFDLSAFRGALLEGTNVLAVHLLNLDQDPLRSDLLLAVALDGDAYMGPGAEARYFSLPTPGGRNVIGDSDFLRPPEFSHARGFYEAPFLLALTASLPQFTIHYTTNGEIPTVASPLYTQALVIAQSTSIRARSYGAGYEPSAVVAHSYLFTQDIKTQPKLNTVAADPQFVASLKGIPTVMLTTPHTNLFGATGIYSNPGGRGVAWERETSMEWIEYGATNGFMQNCGVRIYGGASRNNAKKSFRFLFKRVYGPGKLEFPLFGDDPTAVDRFDTVIFRAGSNDPYTSSGLIDPFMRRVQIDTGGVGSHSTFVHLYLNGEYWGIYNPSERADQAFGASYYDVAKEWWAGVNANSATGESLLDTWASMLAAANNLSVNNQYQRLQGNDDTGRRDTNLVVHLDIQNHIDYMATHIWGGTGDWPGHNWYAGASRTNSTGWKFFVWDAEFSMRTAGLTKNISTTGGPRNLFGALRWNPDFRMAFADRIRRHCFEGGALTPEVLIPRFQAMIDQSRPGILANAARWGTTGTLAGWDSTQAWHLTEWMPKRTAIVVGQLQAAGLYPRVAFPQFGQAPGLFSNTLALAIRAVDPVYYTVDGSDPRALYSGNIQGVLYNAPLSLTDTTYVRARARSLAGEWSAMTEGLFVTERVYDLKITELMVDPYAAPAGSGFDDKEAFEFIEVRNVGAAPLRLGTLRFTEGVDFEFPEVVLAAGAHGLIVADRAAFESRYGLGLPILGVYAGRLNNNGERLVLEGSAQGPQLASFTYNNSRGWPLTATGAGHSLVPLVITNQRDGALDYGGNWRASALRGGSPGVVDPVPVRNLVLNEVVAHTDDPDPLYESNDWLELFNVTGAAIGLGDWYLSDRADNLKRWAIPSSAVVPAGGWIVFDEKTGFNNPTGAGFGLNKSGEQVFLSYLPGDARDRVADAVAFKGQENGMALGRYADGEAYWYALAPTPGSANGVPVKGVTIAEIMYHPAPTATHPEDNTNDEYIEIVNASAAPVELFTDAGPWRIDGGVGYVFPTNFTLAPQGRVLLVSFATNDLAAVSAFETAYGLSAGQVTLLGPYSGKLANGGERIALERPQLPDVVGDAISWVIVDEVIYFNQQPWPGDASGVGVPLQRIAFADSGSDPQSWSSGFSASPGLPPEKVALTRPRNAEHFFVPMTVPLAVAIDENQVSGVVERVVYFLNGEPVGEVTQAPYGWSLSGVDEPGGYRLAAVLWDGAGSNVTREVAIQVLGLEHGGAPTLVSDVAATLHGVLLGEVPAGITLYWGPEDQGTNANLWASQVVLGVRPPGPFAVRLGNLSAEQSIYYRFAGEAGGGRGWTVGSRMLTTLSLRDWPNRLTIGFPGYGRPTALTNFPVLVRLDPSLPGFSYGGFMRLDRSDLRFADSDWRSLPYEVEEWNTNGVSLVWVRVPALRGPETMIRMLGGALVPTGETPPQALHGTVWDETFGAVWHWAGGTMRDSTVGSVVGYNIGSSNTVGVVGSARWFDGVSAYIDPQIYRGWYGTHIEALTVSLWVNPDSTAPGNPFGGYDAVNTNRFTIGGSGFGWKASVGPSEKFFTGTIKSKRWQLLTLVLRDHVAYAAINDSPLIEVGAYPEFTPGASPLFGNVAGGTSSFFWGAIDEVRLAAGARSADWIWAEYWTVASNALFTSYAVTPRNPNDVDDNGFPDSWELRYFERLGVADWDGDYDGDGYLDREEYWAGTDPADEDDYFWLELGSGGGSGEVLVRMASRLAEGEDYPGVSRFYGLEGAGELVPLLWYEIDGWSQRPATGGWLIYSNAPGTNAVHFYRGRVWIE